MNTFLTIIATSVISVGGWEIAHGAFHLDGINIHCHTDICHSH